MMTSRLSPRLILALLLAWASFAALAKYDHTYEKTLSNGLKVIIKEDHRAPTVVHMVWYRVGAMDEVEGSTGVAHVLEHMMFKGTKKFGPGEFNRRVADAGGRDNAFTSLDYTAYFQQTPKDRLGEMMMLEADRMANLIITAEEFAREVKVVMEERRLRTEDRPEGLVYETLMSTAYQVHPYRRPIIGWMQDLVNMTPDQAREWYRRWYTPQNAYVVIVGDVDKDEAFRLAERHYGKLKRRPLAPNRVLLEPDQRGIKRIVVKAPAKLPYVVMAWKVPKLNDIDKDREPFALEMLAGILDGHDAARIPRNLVRGSKIAVSADAGYDLVVRGEAMFALSGTPAEGHTAAELESALRAELGRVQKEGVSAEELERVKTQIIASQVYKRDSIMAQAMEMGRTEAAGFSWRDIDRMLEKIRTVTAEEVQAVANKYFSDDELTVAVLDPQPIQETLARQPAGDSAND